MKADVLVGEKQVEIKEIPMPQVTPGTIKIKVSACGVCGSDIHMWKAGKDWKPIDNSPWDMNFAALLLTPATVISKQATV